jgi:uncharacterized repeat protein (TIGR01451 family)
MKNYLRSAIAAALLAMSFAVASETGLRVASEQIEAVAPAQQFNVDKATRQRDPVVAVIVKYDSPPLASYEGGIPGLAATSPAVTGERLNLRASRNRAYLQHLAGERDRVIQTVRSMAPRASITHDLAVVVGGVAVQAPRSEIDRLREVPGITVYPDELQSLDTFRSPEFIGATSAWERVGGAANAGAGVIVGILDSGIWPENPSFSDPDPAGNPFPAPPPRWQGTTCDFGAIGGPLDAPFQCNNKLIGAARFMATYESMAGLQSYEFRSARDDDGHGTHTAGTAAGNAGTQASVLDLDRGQVSGVAPRAHLAAYKVCGELGCYQSDSAAAIQQAILDGVDVLNFSISGGTNPFADAVSEAFLGAYNAGVFVAASAGNSGPGANTVGHRAPWITTVAASTHDRSFRNSVAVNGGTLTVTGASITAGVPDAASIVWNTVNPLCLNTATSEDFTGQIVVCERGLIARTDKSANVAAKGAVGLVLYNTAPGQSLDLDNHSIPTSHIDSASGTELLAFLAANPNATATISESSLEPVPGDVLAAFSSRGGNGLTLGVLKPDIAAPGVAILAPYTSLRYGAANDPFGFLSGTSMASPHIAGAAALLRQQFPTWTPGMIKSALMTTAETAVLREDGVTPAKAFDTGAGRVDLAAATNPGLTFSAPGSDFVQFQNALTSVNQPSVYTPANPGSVTVNRVARSTLWSAKRWQISVIADPGLSIVAPAGFTLGAGRTVAIPITVDASALPVGQAAQGRLELRTADGSHRAVMPIAAVRRDGAVVIVQTCDKEAVDLGDQIHCDLSVTNNATIASEVTLRDVLPKQLVLQELVGPPGTVRVNARQFRFAGSLFAAGRETFTVGLGTSPGGGYLPLSGFGIAPIAGMGDETIVNFNVPAFTYNGQTWSRLGVVSNGYVVVGGGTGADVDFINQALPDPTRPNNVLAPFWTDLDVDAGGAVRIGTLSGGGNSWIVVDWDAVRNYSGTGVNSFQVWIGTGAVEDITFAYGPATAGDGGFLTVGAESADGAAGTSYYVDGTGTLPTAGTQLRVSTSPGAPGETVTLWFTAEAVQTGDWRNCAELQSSALSGTATSCVSGTVIPAP